MEIFCNIINVFTVTFDQVNASYIDQNCSLSLRSLSLSLSLYIYIYDSTSGMQTVQSLGNYASWQRNEKNIKSHKQSCIHSSISWHSFNKCINNTAACLPELQILLKPWIKPVSKDEDIMTSWPSSIPPQRLRQTLQESRLLQCENASGSLPFGAHGRPSAQ